MHLSSLGAGAAGQLTDRHQSRLAAPAQMRDTEEDALRDAAYDAFMALWCSLESDQAIFWAAYLAAQDRYDVYVQGRS